MKRLAVPILILLITSFSITHTFAAAEGPAADRFERVVNRMVQAINQADYPGIQRDFGQVMLDAFPLEKSKPFFEDLSARYGKIQELDSAQLIPPNQAIFPAHFERGILNIRVVLDNQDKIIELLFLPHIADTAASKEQQRAAGDVNSIADVNAVAEPNDPNATRGRWFQELERVLTHLDDETQEEIRDWVQMEAERRINVAQRIYDRITEEFNAIREVAVEEKAVNTVEAVDRMLQSRAERFERVLKRLEESRREQQRTRGREERRGRDREGRRRDREDRRRERPSRREREP